MIGGEKMEDMLLQYFTDNNEMPFFIHFGGHEDGMKMHFHRDFWELVIVLSGTAAHAVGNEEYLISRGDVFVINSNIPHGYRNTDNFKICNIMFRPDIFNADRSFIGTASGFHALFVIEPFLTENYNFHSRLRLSLNEYGEVKNLLDIIVNEFNNKNAGWQSVVKSYFILLTVYLSRIYNFKDIDNRSSAIYIAKPIAYIEEHFREPISLSELADMANISLRHFTRLFRNTYHMTPISYINSLKLNYACGLLKNTTMSISEVSYSSGFSDSNYFSRIFKKFFGKTPVEYRKN